MNTEWKMTSEKHGTQFTHIYMNLHKIGNQFSVFDHELASKLAMKSQRIDKQFKKHLTCDGAEVNLQSIHNPLTTH